MGAFLSQLGSRAVGAYTAVAQSRVGQTVGKLAKNTALGAYRSTKDTVSGILSPLHPRNILSEVPGYNALSSIGSSISDAWKSTKRNTPEIHEEMPQGDAGAGGDLLGRLNELVAEVKNIKSLLGQSVDHSDSDHMEVTNLLRASHEWQRRKANEDAVEQTEIQENTQEKLDEIAKNTSKLGGKMVSGDGGKSGGILATLGSLLTTFSAIKLFFTGAAARWFGQHAGKTIGGAAKAIGGAGKFVASKATQAASWIGGKVASIGGGIGRTLSNVGKGAAELAGKVNPLKILKSFGQVAKKAGPKLLKIKIPIIGSLISAIMGIASTRSVMLDPTIPKGKKAQLVGEEALATISRVIGTGALGALGGALLGPVGAVLGGILGDAGGAWLGRKLGEWFGAEGFGHLIMKTFGEEDSDETTVPGMTPSKDASSITGSSQTQAMPSGKKMGDEMLTRRVASTPGFSGNTSVYNTVTNNNTTNNNVSAPTVVNNSTTANSETVPATVPAEETLAKLMLG